MEDVARRRLALSWLPPLAWAATILFLSSQPAEELPPVLFWQADKLIHMGVYALLGALGGRAAARSGLGRRGSAAVLAAGIGFGLFDEWYQQFTPGRASDLADAVADAVGASAGFLLVLRYHRARHVPRHPPLR